MFWLSASSLTCSWNRSAAPKKSSPSTWINEIWDAAAARVLKLGQVPALVYRVFDERRVLVFLRKRTSDTPIPT